MNTILFLAANPSDATQLNLQNECRDISRKLRAGQFPRSFELRSAWAVRPTDLLDCLNEHRPHVVHFSGHGSPNGLILHGSDDRTKPVERSALRVLFRAVKDNIRVVVLNACYSRAQAKAIVETVDCAIGMKSAIGDTAAITFAAAFYGALAFGLSVKQAFDQGCLALRLEGIQEHKTPVLLARTGVDPGRMFLAGAEAESAAGSGINVSRSAPSQQPIATRQPPRPSRSSEDSAALSPQVIRRSTVAARRTLSGRADLRRKPRKSGPRLIAKFQEQNGKLRPLGKKRHPAYWIDLWVERAPQETNVVVFEILDEGFSDSKWKVKRPKASSATVREFLTNDMNSYGDVAIWARGAGSPTGEWTIKSTLYQALRRFYRGRETSDSVRRALEQIRVL